MESSCSFLYLDLHLCRLLTSLLDRAPGFSCLKSHSSIEQFGERKGGGGTISSPTLADGIRTGPFHISSQDAPEPWQWAQDTDNGDHGSFSGLAFPLAGFLECKASFRAHREMDVGRRRRGTALRQLLTAYPGKLGHSLWDPACWPCHI